MKPKKCVAIHKDWDVNLETATFCSPSKDLELPGQAVVFGDTVNNGSISASITAIGRYNTIGEATVLCDHAVRCYDGFRLPRH
jgi:hypothetical protein